MHEREDPGARLAAFGHEAGGRAPDGEERLLHRILGQRLVAQDAQREPVRGAAIAVVELGERRLLRASGESDERFVGKVGELPVHSFRYSRVEHGRFKGHLKATGVRPAFAEKLADLGIRLTGDLFQTEGFVRRAVGLR